MSTKNSGGFRSPDEGKVILSLLVIFMITAVFVGVLYFQKTYSPANTPPIPPGEWLYLGPKKPTEAGQSTAVMVPKDTIETKLYNVDICQEAINKPRQLYLTVTAEGTCTGAAWDPPKAQAH